MTTETTRKCEQPGCTVATDGRCLEGVANPADCPHFVRVQDGQNRVHDTAEDENGGVAELEPAQPDNWISLTDGYELTLTAAAAITSGADARVVVLAGEPDSGKTTLIACIYEKFSEGAFAGHRFAGSETLLAFERTCYLSRTISEAETPDTERTKVVEPRFFHLTTHLSNLNNSNETELLFTDVSGEAYRRALDNSEDAAKMGFVRRADRFVLLLDGARLSEKTERQDCFRRGVTILQALTECGHLGEHSDVWLVFSKFDLLKPKLVDRNTEEFIAFVKSEFQKFAKDKFMRFRIAEIASRPISGSGLAYAHGVDGLLQDWLAKGSDTPEGLSILYGTRPQGTRESDQFLWHHFAH